MTVTFVNPLRVPPDREAEFLEKWDRGAAYVRERPGFVSTSLHRSLSPQSQFQFVTIAVWESADHFQQAQSTEWWRDFVADFGFGDGPADFGAAPMLCEVVRA